MALDLLNPYGLRVLAPFDWQWFYGDALFIIDPWLWITLGVGVWMSRRRIAVAPARRALFLAAIYIVVIMYGQSIMTSVQEEKRDRIVELIVSSVRARDLLVGWHIENRTARGEWRFLWVRDFPLFEWDKDAKRWAPRNNMFTMPNAEHLELLERDPGKVHAQLYDLVLNGTELGSGSIRIHRTDIQERVMKVIGLSREEAYRKFGFLLEAYQFASPPHGGIGLGFDRIVMLMGRRDSLRETIAFPKSASAASLMDGSPSEVEPEQLEELRIRVEE